MILATSVSLDLIVLGAMVSIGVPTVSLFVAVARFAKNIEVRLNSLAHENQLQNYRLDAALQLLDKRLRDLEYHAEKVSSFHPHHARDEDTGAPFLRD